MSIEQAQRRLLESSTELHHPLESFAVKDHVHALLEHAHEQGELPTEAAWRLAPLEERKLVDRYGEIPGTWSSLCGLAAGAGILQAKRHYFVPTMSLEELDAMSQQDLQVQLIEALTCRLVPPQVAASLFIALNIHPAWGLRLAYGVQNTGEHRIEPMDTMFDADHVEMLAGVVFGLIETIWGIIDGLVAERSYSRRAFGAAIAAAVEEARQEAPGVQTGVSMFLETGLRHTTVVDVLATELVDDVLIPAGVVGEGGQGRVALLAVPSGVHIGRPQGTERPACPSGRSTA